MAQEININNMNEELMKLKREVARLRAFMKEDLAFIQETEQAWREFDNGEFVEMNDEDFLEEIERW
ncbi:MAG: hypothetical protein ACP5D2_00990 [Candidatus Nanoarchaeia archaeon]